LSVHRQKTQASILDRLIDAEPGNAKEPAQYHLLDYRQIKALVVRDLEHLLNTRRFIGEIPETCRYLATSVLFYGLKDYTAVNPNSTQARQSVLKDVEKAIALFEPRLKNVKVRWEKSETKERSLSFRITAMLVVDPIREPVAFDTYYDTSRGAYVINDERSG